MKNATEPGLQPYVPKTNEVASASNVEHLKQDPDVEVELEEKAPVVDAALEEAQRILTDYISLLPATDHALSKAE